MLRKEGLPTIKNFVGYHFKTPFVVTNCFLIKTWLSFWNKNWFLENRLIVKTVNDILTSLIYLTKKWNLTLWLQSIINKLSIFSKVPNIESMYWINIYLWSNVLLTNLSFTIYQFWHNDDKFHYYSTYLRQGRAISKQSMHLCT